jgi:hypothetical protein
MSAIVAEPVDPVAAGDAVLDSNFLSSSNPT